MDARTWAPPPPRALDLRIRHLAHDLQRARIDLALGRLPPAAYAALAPALRARLQALEAQRLAQLPHVRRLFP